MAVTVRDIISRAYHKLGMVAADTPMSAEEALNGVIAWNHMLWSLPLFGVRFEHTEQGLNDAVTIGEAFHEGLVLLLARRLAPDYGLPWPDEDEWLRRFQAAHYEPAPISSDPAIRSTPSQQGRQRAWWG